MGGKQRFFWAAAVLLLAVFARFWGITAFPPGLYPDQAANGEDALRILGGEWQIFSLRNNGRESMFFYFAALMLWLFGVGVWQLFAATALVGVLTVIFTYLAAVRLFGRGAALWAAFFLATNPWHVTLSRNGFRAVTTPLIIALALWFWARLFQSTARRSRYCNAAGAGLFSGLVLYTYLAGRAFVIFLFLAGLIFLVQYWRRPDFRKRFRPFFRPLLFAAAAGILTALPLFLFALKHPVVLGARAGHVSVFNPELNQGSPLGTLLRMTGKSILAFVWEGDGNPRHNVPWPNLPYHPGGRHEYAGGGVPLLSFLPAALAAVGLFAAWRRARWLLLLFAAALLPAALTAEGMPHGLRLVAAIPAHVFFAGLGAEWIRRRAEGFWGRRGGAVLGAVVLALAVVNAGLDLGLYFGVARNLPLVHYEYRGDLTVVSGLLNERAKLAQSPPPYLVLDDFSEMTVKFLTQPAGRPYRLVKPERSHEVVLRPGEEIIFTQSTLPDAERYLRRHREARISRRAKNRFGETIMLVVGRKQ